MKTAPIIHTRTYNCDFNANFMVRPKKFLGQDTEWARKIVLEATKSIDTLQGQGERWLIADNGKYRMAGVVGFLNKISGQCNLSDTEKQDSEKLFNDNKKRPVYAFIGIIIETSDMEQKLHITRDYLWRLYLKHVEPVWKRTYQETILVDFNEYDGEIGYDDYQPKESSKRRGSLEMYQSNVEDYELFEYYLDKNIGHTFSFCSNLTDIKVVQGCKFSIITTSSNIIERLMRENEKETSLNIQNDEPSSSESEKKKTNTVWKILAILLAIVIVILLCILGRMSRNTAVQLTLVINSKDPEIILDVVKRILA